MINSKDITCEQTNKLLNKVKLEATTGEELLKGLLNINLICKYSGLYLTYGNLLFDMVLTVYPTFTKLFNNEYFCKHIRKHFNVITSSANAETMPYRLGKIDEDGKKEYSTRRSVNTHIKGIGDLPLKDAIKCLRKKGIFTIGPEPYVKYVIDSEFNITNEVSNISFLHSRNLCIFKIMVETTKPSLFGSIYQYAEVASSSVYQFDFKSTEHAAVIFLYTAGLIGNVNMRSDILKESTDPHNNILATFIRTYFHHYLTDGNDHWLLDDSYDLAKLKESSALTSNENFLRGQSRIRGSTSPFRYNH